METAPSEMRARLLGVKLSALIRDHHADADIVAASFPGGAAALVGPTAWVLLDEQPDRALGGAIAWSVRQGATAVEVLAETATDTLARRSAAFDLSVSVRHVEGRTLLPAVAEGLAPEPAPDPDHVALTTLIAEGGAEPTIEHGIVAGEVLGLEVCRVVDDENTGEPRLEVGIGAHDREAFAMLHGARPTIEALRGVVDAVRPHREPSAAPHPLNRLAGERALRHRAIAAPDRIGASGLAAAAPPVPRSNVKDAVPCVALGAASDGRPLVAVFSTGVDLDVVPFATDARTFHSAADDETALVIVVPERDRFAVTEMLAGLLRHPAQVVGWVD